MKLYSEILNWQVHVDYGRLHADRSEVFQTSTRDQIEQFRLDFAPLLSPLSGLVEQFTWRQHRTRPTQDPI